MPIREGRERLAGDEEAKRRRGAKVVVEQMAEETVYRRRMQKPATSLDARRAKGEVDVEGCCDCLAAGGVVEGQGDGSRGPKERWDSVLCFRLAQQRDGVRATRLAP